MYQKKSIQQKKLSIKEEIFIINARRLPPSGWGSLSVTVLLPKLPRAAHKPPLGVNEVSLTV